MPRKRSPSQRPDAPEPTTESVDAPPNASETDAPVADVPLTDVEPTTTVEPDGGVMVAAPVASGEGDDSLPPIDEPEPTGAVIDPAVDGAEPTGPFPGPARAAPRSVSEIHLKGIIESLVFASDKPLTPSDVGRIARADARDVRRLLDELREEYRGRGIQLDEVAGGWQFRSSAANAPFVRELLQAKPVRLTRAQVETLAIIAYRQPITRPEVDELRGVDSGSAVKILLERELIRMLGRKEEVGRPVLYGTTGHFLEFFGLKSLRDLPTLREFTDLTPESEATLVRELEEEGIAPAADAAPPAPPPVEGPSPDATPSEAAPTDGAPAAQSADLEPTPEPDAPPIERDDSDESAPRD